jgi:rSAM/selenodomain-associated transferase 1
VSHPSGLIIFAKKPLAGQVKSRLQPKISPEMSLEIYRFFVEETLEKVKALSYVSIWLGCFPDQNHPWFLELSRKFNLRLFNQKGEDLGARMANAFDLLTHEKIEKKVIIGTDSPHLPLHFIRSAFELLEKTRVILGPSRDGGYYLLGLAGDPPSIFDGIAWSTDSVFKSTSRKLEGQNIPFKLLPEWYDIDQFNDLFALYRHWENLKENGGEVPEKLFYYLDCLEPIRKEKYVS